MLETKVCSKCGVEKELTEYQKDKSKRDGLSYSCKVCKKEYYVKNKERILTNQKIYRDSNPEKVSEKNRRYHKNNPDYYKIWNRKNPDKVKKKVKKWVGKNPTYFIDKYHNDMLYRVKVNMRNRLNTFIGLNGMEKSKSTFDVVGCDPQFLKEYLEKQFKGGMSWENRGDWHIDHIIPLSSANNEDEVYELCHYSNLQPLWAEENLSKGSKIL